MTTLVKLAELVQELALNANVKSVKMLTLPRGKPERWDVADAISEGFDINEFLNTTSNFTRQNINLLDDSLLVSRFVGPSTRTKVSGRRHVSFGGTNHIIGLYRCKCAKVCLHWI